jgi:hypothetical protein
MIFVKTSHGMEIWHKLIFPKKDEVKVDDACVPINKNMNCGFFKNLKLDESSTSIK